MQGAKLSEEIHTKKDPHSAQLEGVRLKNGKFGIFKCKVRKYSTNHLIILQTTKRVWITETTTTTVRPRKVT